jgi:flagellar motility protein MotE (MotC chaperone)
MKLNRSHLAWALALVVTLAGASSVQSAQDEQKPSDTTEAAAQATPAAPEKKAVLSASSDSCLSDPAVLEEIAKKQQEIDQRQKDFALKEAELNARENAINDEIKRLQDFRQEIATVEQSQSKANESKVAKVVDTLESMSPKAAAQMLTGLDDGLAVSAVSRMSTAKLAKIMNVIDAKRAAKLTELLAGVVRAKNSTVSSDAAVTTRSPEVAKKGEETNDNKPESIISGGPDQFAQRAPSSTGAGSVGQ